jgi:hypothetical protein
MNDKKTTRILVLMLIALVTLVVLNVVEAQQAPTSYADTYPLTFERNDFIATAGATTFTTRIATRGKFVLVFRNGMLQFPCAAGQLASTCDYTVSGNMVITYPVNEIGVGDSITLVFFG